MLDLRRDVYARLVISAQKNRALNRPFKVVHSDNPVQTTPMSGTIGKDDSNGLNAAVSNTMLVMPKQAETQKGDVSIVPPARIQKTEKIDDKIDKIVNDPVLAEIKAELEFAEALLSKIKSVDGKNPKISIIEDTITRLKAMLEQKSYV